MPSLDPVVTKLSGYLQEGPIHFEITILPNNTTNEDKQLTLEESIVLIDGQHLGLDARSLPWMTRDIRQAYWQCRRAQENSSSRDGDLLLTVTSCLLLVNPDHATAWADRRRCLLLFGNDGKHSWPSELAFLNLLMTQHSKATSSWGHRKYVLGKIIDQILSEDEGEETRRSALLQLARDEMDTCTQVAERYPKNYYAWTHRRYLWTLLLPHIQPPNNSVVLQEEFLNICKWLQRHVSDHSAVHYGTQVLELWVCSTQFKEVPQRQQISDTSIAQHALKEVQRLVQHHESHEAMWIFRRLVVGVLLQHLRDRTLVIQEIQTVYKEVVSTEGKKETASVVHAWTFLVWSVMQLQYVGEVVDDLDLSTAVSVLQQHSDVAHEMWKVYGSAILGVTTKKTAS